MALFGSSPLLLSVIAAHQFNDQLSGINVTRFLAFLSLLTGATHLFGAIALPGRGDNPTPAAGEPRNTAADEENTSSFTHATDSGEADADERSALLPPNKHKTGVEVTIVPVQEPEHGSTIDLLRDRNFWVLAMIVVIVIGTVSLCIHNPRSRTNLVGCPV